MTKIKSLLIGFVLLAGIALPAHAQLGEQRHNFAIGVNGGMNYSTASFQPTIKQNGLMGITGGITARYISEKYFAMICGAQIEINYSQRGWDEEFKTESDTPGEVTFTKDDSYTRTMHYLEIPFLAHLAFGKDKGAQFFVNIGPQIGFMISEKEKRTGDWSEADRYPNEQYGKKIENKFDYGIAGGAGLEIRTKKAGNFLIEGRYYFGLADFYKSTKKDPFARSAHNVISARITYLFDLKK